jgi:hypothetical protein
MARPSQNQVFTSSTFKIYRTLIDALLTSLLPAITLITHGHLIALQTAPLLAAA